MAASISKRIATTKASDAELPTAAVGVTMRDKNLQMWVKHTALLRTGYKIRKHRNMMEIGLVCLYVQFEVATMCC